MRATARSASVCFWGTARHRQTRVQCSVCLQQEHVYIQPLIKGTSRTLFDGRCVLVRWDEWRSALVARTRSVGVSRTPRAAIAWHARVGDSSYAQDGKRTIFSVRILFAWDLRFV